MYYRQNNLNVTYPLLLKPDEQNQSTWFSVPNADWFSDNTDAELAAWGVTRHDDPVMPEYDAYAEKVERGSDGEYLVVALTQAELQSAINIHIAQKFSEIRTGWAAANAQPVEWDGIEWNGGIDSAMLIDAANRGALKSVEAMEQIFDYNNEPHLLTTTQIDSLVRELRAVAKPIFHQKQTYMRQVQAIQTSAAQEGADLAQLRRDLDAITITY